MKKRYVSPPAPAFINLSEYDDFQTPNRFIARTLAEAPLASGRTAKREVKLDFHVKSKIREVLASGGESFSAICVTVRDEDGMSWSAEAVNALLVQESSDLRRWCLSNTLTTDSLPVIADLVGLNTFLGLAATHGLAQSHFSFLSLRRGAKAAILVVAVLLGSALQILGVWQRLKGGAGQTIANLLGDWIFYAINIGLAAIGLVAQNVMAKYSANPKTKAIEELAKNLQLEDVVKKQNFDRFVDALARKLQSVDFPKAVIIDNFSALDLTTKRVIARYFQKYSGRARGSELWVIFQGGEGERFSTLAVQDLGSHGFRYTQFFEQLVFTEADKKDLIKAVGRKEDEAMVFVTAKRIVHADIPADKDTIDFFELERTNHPIKASYGALDLFYLLSLTADRVSLTQNFVTANFSPKTGLTAELLKTLLPGTRLRREEFNTGWNDIRDRFAPMLIIEPNTDSAKLRVIPEKTRVLKDMEDKLALPNTELGHVFWSLFWSDKLQNHPVQAVWTRKLTEHLLKSSASTIDEEETYIAVQHRLFDAILLTVEGSLKTCLFSNITLLLQKGLDLANGELAKTDQEKKLLLRLLAKCWEAYSVLGSEEILRLILEIYEATPFDRERAVPDDRRLLERLFFESIALAPEKRRRLKPNFFNRGNVPTATSDAMSDYAAIRAAWLALAAARHVNSDVNKFFSALVSADAGLARMASDSFARLNNTTEESIRAVNILTLSLSMWCRALRFNLPVTQSRIAAGLAAKRTLAGALEPTDFSEEVVAVAGRTFGDLPALIETAEDAVLLAAELSRGAVSEPSAPATVDYLMRGLAKELCAVALASVVMANKYSDGRLLNATHIARVNDLIRISNDFLGDSLPQVSTSEDLLSSQLVSKVESIMKLCGLIWNEFGLERLRDFVNIRRVHFHAVCMMSAPDDFTAQNALLKSLGHLLNEPDFGGIMANLVASESLTLTEELKVYYLIHAAELGLADRFGQNVRNQLCLTAILGGDHFSYPLDPFIEHLLVERSDLASLLLRFLKSLPEEELEITYLKLLNASKLTKNRNSGAAIVAEIVAFTNTIQTPDVKVRVEALLDTVATEQRIREGLAIDVPALLGGWSDRKDLWLFASLLDTLFLKGYGSEILQKEAVALLENREPANDKFNSYFLLSINLASYLVASGGQGGRLIVTNYLKDSVENWKAQSSADTNVLGFQLLYRLDPTHADDYLKEIEKWQMVKLERDHLKSLPRLLSHGQLFLVFQYYFGAMEFWGLRADVSSQELATLINVPSDERRKRAREWREAGAVVPEPLIGKGTGAQVSSKFLKIGSDLFSAPISEDANFDRERQMFNECASTHLHHLLGLILGLPDLPMPAKDLIRSYLQRLDTYTLPEGT